MNLTATVESLATPRTALFYDSFWCNIDRTIATQAFESRSLEKFQPRGVALVNDDANRACAHEQAAAQMSEATRLKIRNTFVHSLYMPSR